MDRNAPALHDLVLSKVADLHLHVTSVTFAYLETFRAAPDVPLR